MKYQYWFANIKGLSNAGKIMLMEYFPCAEEIYIQERSSLELVTNLTQKDIEAILASKKEWDLDQEFMKFMATGMSFVSLESKAYPEKLRNLWDKPYALFYAGNLPETQKKSVAIVGSRGRSAYGNAVAKKLAYSLAKHGVSIISGMALGIDSDAHGGALEANGLTYAVLGCGPDICYPRQNKYLYDQILQRGGILSENPLGTSAMSYLFPLRNRIISGLADAVIVVEAKLKSGSLITADYAMEQGKDVYAVPGRLNDPLSQGCNHLIYQGAGIVEDVEIFVKDFLEIEENQLVQLDFRKNILEKEERLVYSLLDFDPKGLGTLVENSGMTLTELLAILNALIQKGFVIETVPNYFTRTL